MKYKIINDGITITVVIMKKVDQSPSSQSTRLPEDEAKVVLLLYQLMQVKHIELQ